jgi:hypothetical protein
MPLMRKYKYFILENPRKINNQPTNQLHGKENSHSDRKKFPTFYGNQRFITVFTRACHWSLPYIYKFNKKFNGIFAYLVSEHWC